MTFLNILLYVAMDAIRRRRHPSVGQSHPSRRSRAAVVRSFPGALRGDASGRAGS
jgi:hypothetical protein